MMLGMPAGHTAAWHEGNHHSCFWFLLGCSLQYTCLVSKSIHKVRNIACANSYKVARAKTSSAFVFILLGHSGETGDGQGCWPSIKVFFSSFFLLAFMILLAFQFHFRSRKSCDFISDSSRGVSLAGPAMFANLAHPKRSCKVKIEIL